jgi:hypothetical protein
MVPRQMLSPESSERYDGLDVGKSVQVGMGVDVQLKLAKYCVAG